MSLVKCPECNREISDEACCCPNCGKPMMGGSCDRKDDKSKEQEDTKPKPGIITG